MSRRSIRKRRHRLEGVSAQFIIIDEAADFEFERVTIGGVDVTEMVSSVSYSPLVVGIDPGIGQSKTVIARRHADGRLELEELP